MKHTQKILSLAMAMIFASSAWAGNGKGGPDSSLNGTCVADGTCTANLPKTLVYLGQKRITHKIGRVIANKAHKSIVAQTGLAHC